MIRKSHSLFDCRLVIILALLLLTHPVVSAVSKPPADITGYYFFAGKAPKGFEDVDWISLATVDTQGR